MSTLKARQLTTQLGFRVAAGYLRNRGVHFDAAYRILFGRAPRI